MGHSKRLKGGVEVKDDILRLGENPVPEGANLAVPHEAILTVDGFDGFYIRVPNGTSVPKVCEFLHEALGYLEKYVEAHHTEIQDFEDGTE
jgi:hypothetical protein